MPDASWSDAWVFHAILAAHGNGEGDLASVIAYGDALNHAIITYPEMHNGLELLSALGLIAEDDDVFAPTDKAIEIMGAGPPSRQKTRIEHALGGVMPWSKDYDPEELRGELYPGLTRDRYDAAQHEAHRRSRA